MKVQLAHDPVRLGWGKGFIQGTQGVGVEIVQHDVNPMSVRELDVDQVAQTVSKVLYAGW